MNREQNKIRLKMITQGALIAAMYVALTYVFQPISFGAIQVRIAEALTILPIFTPAAIPGLFIGCVLGNTLGGAVAWDIVFGSLATLIGAIFTYLLRKKHPLIGTVPPIVSNTLIVPFVLKYAYQVEMSIPLLMLTILVGEVISCGAIGGLLGIALKRSRVFLSKNKKDQK